MTQALEEFKAFLLKNEGKLPMDHLVQSVTFVDRFGPELTASPQERESIQGLLAKAYNITPAILTDHFQRGHMMAQNYKDTFHELIPEGLGQDYVKFVHYTEPPTSFHFFSFLTVMGALLGRQTWVEQEIYQVWPASTTLLAGPTATRKTTAAEFAMKMGYEADPERFVQFQKITSEKLHSRLASMNPACGIMYTPEMSAVINKKDYNKTLISDLTNLWDCPDHLPVETMGRTETLHNVALSALMCSNEEWLMESVPDHAFKGGFFSRIVPVYEPVPDLNRLYARPKKLDAELKQELIYGLVETARVKGPATLTRQADKLFEKLYKQVRRTLPAEPRMGTWMSRMPTSHLLRIALLLSVMEHRREKIYIEEYHIEQSYAILMWIVDRLPKLFSFLGTSSVGEDAKKVIQTVYKNGGRMSRAALTSTLFGNLSAKNLDDVVRTLKQAGIMQQLEGGLFDDNPTAVYYKLLKAPEDV
ncbi:MAG: DUF3987 domain-containing protein [Dehalococcoidia bacterium]|nr:MAG: DUF3987 domain-containing protein [Dehalococcoidia bacterium]